MCFGETFAALVKGLQGALWELGGVPRVVRTDNLSAATHELRDSRGRAMNASYEAVLAHYGVEARWSVITCNYTNRVHNPTGSAKLARDENPMPYVMIPGFLCERCGHRWVRKQPGTLDPKVCPKCKSPY